MYIVQILKEVEVKQQNIFNNINRGPDIMPNNVDSGFDLSGKSLRGFVSPEDGLYKSEYFWVDDKYFSEPQDAKVYATNLITDQEKESARYSPTEVRVVKKYLEFKVDIIAVENE